MMSDELVNAARMALDALEYHVAQTRPIYKTSVAITALRAALQDEGKQEPVASLMTNIQSGDVELVWNDDGFDRAMWHETPLYPAPQKRQQSLSSDDNSANFQITHAEGCWSWGPKHYLCACNEISKMRGYK